MVQPDNREGYHDDGYGGYSAYPNTTPNPYDIQPSPSPNLYEHEHQGFQPIHPDPFAIPQHDTYAPMPVSSPPLGEYQPHPGSYLTPYQNQDGLRGPSIHAVTPPPQPLPSPTQTYSLHDTPYEFNEQEDGGEIPLLRRDGPPGPLPIPGGYDDDGLTPDDRSESNIRYGRIPQRVPRRYKTMKRVK